MPRFSIRNPYFIVVICLALAALRRGEFGAAQHHCERSLELCQTVGDPSTAGVTIAWLGEVEANADVPYDRAMARLGLAVTRGLLLDLVATDDQAGVDAAAEAFVSLLGR